MSKIIRMIQRISLQPIRRIQFSNKVFYAQKEYRTNDEVINIMPANAKNQLAFTISVLNKNVFKSFIKAQDLHTYIYRYGDHRVLDSYGGYIMVSNKVKDKYDILVYSSQSDTLPILSWKGITRYEVKHFFYIILMMLVTQDTEVLETFKEAK